MQMVKVNNRVFRSIAKAAKFLQMSKATLSMKLSGKQAITHKDLLIEKMPLSSSMAPKPKIRKQTPKDGVKVLCKTTGVTYNSIMAASRVAGVNNWTMGQKMEASGGFVDKNGHLYVRLTPMNTINKYKDTGQRLQKTRTASHQLKLGLPERVETTEQTMPPVVSIPPVAPKPEVPQIVKDAINDKIIQLLKEKGVYDDVIALLKYGGLTSVKFDPKQNG